VIFRFSRIACPPNGRFLSKRPLSIRGLCPRRFFVARTPFLQHGQQSSAQSKQNLIDKGNGVRHDQIGQKKDARQCQQPGESQARGVIQEPFDCETALGGVFIADVL